MGNEIFEKVVSLSGLPPKLIKKELTTLLKKEGVNPKEMTITILRKVLARYLQEIIQKDLTRRKVSSP